NERDVLLEPEPDLELYRPEAFPHVARHLLRDVVERVARVAAIGARRICCHAGPQGAAQELVDRRSEPLSLDVPQGNVDAAQRRDDQSLLPLIAKMVVEELPDPLRGEGILAQQQRPEGLHDGRIEPGRPEAFAPAGRAVLAYDLDDATGACIGAIEGP